jgi:small subunit ribosomal protein S10
MNAQVHLLLKSFEVQSQTIIEKIFDIVRSETTTSPSQKQERSSWNTKPFVVETPSNTKASAEQRSYRSAISTKQTDSTKNFSFGKSKSVHSIRLPKTSTQYTILRSPHIDKKSREQFEIKVHKHLFCIETDMNQINTLFIYLKQHSISGVQLKMTLNYRTRL